MPIAGLLITLTSPEHAGVVRDAVSSFCDAEFGELNERWLPVAVDSTDQRAARDAHEKILALSGVSYVDVISVHMETDSPEDEPVTLGKQRQPSGSPSRDQSPKA